MFLEFFKSDEKSVELKAPETSLALFWTISITPNGYAIFSLRFDLPYYLVSALAIEKFSSFYGALLMETFWGDSPSVCKKFHSNFKMISTV